MADYQYRPDELLVHVDDCGLVQSELSGHGYRRAEDRGSLRRFVGTPGPRAVPDLLAELRTRHGANLRISPNHVFGCDRIPWGLRPTQTDFILPGLPLPVSRIEVGVVDTGIVLQNGSPHPYIAGHLVPGPVDEDQVDPDNPRLSDGHGTFVTGVIVQEAPDVTVRMKGVIDRGSEDTEDVAVAKAIDSLGGQGVELINLSFSGATWEDAPPPAIEDALRRLGGNVVVVAAAGNRSLPRKVYPAAIDLGTESARVIAVGAVDSRGELRVADFSNFGNDWVEVYAPGVAVVGPRFDKGVPGSAEWSGTSFAAATVTGRIAARMTAGSSAIEAASAVLASPYRVTVWDVNGPREMPYVAATGAPTR